MGRPGHTFDQPHSSIQAFDRHLTGTFLRSPALRPTAIAVGSVPQLGALLSARAVCRVRAIDLSAATALLASLRPAPPAGAISADCAFPDCAVCDQSTSTLLDVLLPRQPPFG